MVIVTWSPSGSLAPDSVTVTNLWFGGHRASGVATTDVHTGGLFVFDGDGETDGDFDGDAEGDFDGDGDVDGEADGEGDFDGDGEVDGVGEWEADIDGDTDG